jgi:hypothetical protein
VLGLTGQDRGPDLQGSGRPTRRRRSGLSAGDPGLSRDGKNDLSARVPRLAQCVCPPDIG